MNIYELGERECSGCGNCGAVCPTGAISFKFDEYGFYQPEIDNSKCVDCGKCTEVCPKRNDLSDCRDVRDGKLYAAKFKDRKILLECTSGGAAWALAEKAADEGRYLVGCIYDSDKDCAKHIITSDIKEAESFKGSKYIQSVTDECFKEVVSLAKRDRTAKFMIFGTPCQIYGLMSELERMGTDVIAVDLFCHGTPTQKLWERYLEQLGMKCAEKVSFRSKGAGWHNSAMEICADGRRYFRSRAARDKFYEGYFDVNTNRESCIDCPLSKRYSKADIRLGDFWNERFADDNDGVSAVLVLTEKGREAIEGTASLELLGEIPTSEYKNTKGDKKPEKIDRRARNTVLEGLKNGDSLKTVLKKARKTYPLKKRILQTRLDLSARLKGLK